MKRENKIIKSSRPLPSSVVYQRTLEISRSLVSKFEIFLLNLSVIFLLLQYFYDSLLLLETQSLITLLCLLALAHTTGKIFWGVRKESVFIIKALGLQTTVTYHSNFKTSIYIPWHSIEDVVINEAISMQQVVCYLGVVVNTKDNDTGNRSQFMIPVFVHAQPRLTELKEIYSHVQEVIGN